MEKKNGWKTKSAKVNIKLTVIYEILTLFVFRRDYFTESFYLLFH